MYTLDGYMPDEFVHSACWIRGFYIYKEVENKTDECSYFGIPRDVQIDGIDNRDILFMFAFTVVFRVATIRSRPDAVGKGTLLFLKAYISILNSVGNFKNPHLLLKKLTRASLGLPVFCN